jgi:hypothetical protein
MRPHYPKLQPYSIRNKVVPKVELRFAPVTGWAKVIHKLNDVREFRKFPRRNPALLRGKKLDCYFGGNLPDSFVNFLRRVGEPIRVDLDSDVTPGTAHMLVRL